MKIRVSGIWRDAEPYIRVAGVWKPVTMYQRIGGVWKADKKKFSELTYGNLVYINYNGVNEQFIVIGKDVHGAGNITIMNKSLLYLNAVRWWDEDSQNEYVGSSLDSHLVNDAWSRISAAHRAICQTVGVECYSVSLGINTISRAIFALSMKEIGCSDYLYEENNRCQYFDLVPAETANSKRLFYDGATALYWWLRTRSSSTYAKNVTNTAVVVSRTQTNTYPYWRFALVINGDQEISKDPDGNGVFSFIT